MRSKITVLHKAYKPELARATTDSRPPSAAQLRASGAIEPLPPRVHFPSLNSPP
jgi:hypothetical protein